MKKILCFAGSNSSKSINHKLVTFAASQIVGQKVGIIKLIDYDLPLFSEDIEREKRYSVALKILYNKIREADALVISVNEHNRTVSAFFKNTLDWLSRLDRNFLEGKKNIADEHLKRKTWGCRILGIHQICPSQVWRDRA